MNFGSAAVSQAKGLAPEPSGLIGDGRAPLPNAGDWE
jgi:hypothetical protein